MNIIAIGAHPDDIEYGCGGTLMRHIKRGDNVTFIVMSRGEKGGDPESRVREAREAARKIGADLKMFEYPDADIPQGHEVIDKLENVIKELKPTRVYTHSVKDTHQDHRNIAYATLVAARLVPEIFAYESPSLYLNFSPNYYVDISSYIDAHLDDAQSGFSIGALGAIAEFLTSDDEPLTRTWVTLAYMGAKVK